MPRPTETWEGCRWTRTDPPVNVESSEPTDHQLLFRKKWTVVRGFTTAMIQSLNRFELELLGSYMKKLEFLAELRACESILAHKLYL